MANKNYNLVVYEKAFPNDMSWVDKLSAAKKVGFDGIEISIDESDWRLERLTNYKLQQEIKMAIDAVGLPIRSMCLSGHRKYPLGSNDPKIQERSLEIFRQAVDLAVTLGIGVIQLAGYDVYYEESSDQTVADFEKNLRQCVAYAASRGIVCGFETMETEFMNTVQKAMHYVNLVDSPYLHVYPDLGNITNAAVLYQSDVYEDIKSGKGHLVAAHIKETTPGVFREVFFGKGHVNFDKGIKALWDQGVRLFGCEFWYDPSTDYYEILKYNYDFVSRYLKELDQ